MSLNEQAEFDIIDWDRIKRLIQIPEQITSELGVVNNWDEKK